ncbi:MAG TPA: hypothetical protein VKQ30_25420 [Ktedonobacterales bacterium]|nr:hypothetical protein [Ktedonobacterales bacterium]
MNLRGITAVLFMVGAMGVTAILGMIVISVAHDGDLTTGVLSNLNTIAVTAVAVASTLIAHYIGAGAAGVQQQQQLDAQANTLTAAASPASDTAGAGPAAPSAPPGSGI